MPCSQPAVSWNKGKKIEKMGSNEGINFRRKKIDKPRFRAEAFRRTFERRRQETLAS